MRNITKRIYLQSRECLTRGWYIRTQGDDVPTDAERFRMEEGVEIGRYAHDLFPGGVLVQGSGILDSLSCTRRLMADPNVSVLFEATFHVDDYTARADILVRHGDGWKVVEVKSNLNNPDVPKKLTDDLAYTVMVASRNGVNVTQASLLRLSRDFRKGMSPQQMFVEIDARAAVQERLADFSSCWNEIQECTGCAERPEPTLIAACRDCSFFSTVCLGKVVKQSIFAIPRLRPKQVEALKARGIIELTAIPASFPLNERQRVVADCARSGRQRIGKGLAASLSKIKWPACYLDFETVATGLPLYPDVAPRASVVTQYSIHRCAAPGQIEQHFEYLADPERNCQRELTEKLLADLRTEGDIIVYSHYEKTQIGELAKLFPDLADPLRLVIDRLFDLCGVIRSQYYHPDFQGSYSIKSVLPALVPGMTYDNLEIRNGDDAMVRFARMALGQFSAEECQSIRRNLLTYCKQDTLAMVRLHQRLLEISRSS